MKKILVSALFVAALLPSLAFGQAIKQGTTSSAGDAGSNIPLCRASAAAETINTEDKYGYLSCDLDGNVRTTGTTSLSWSGSTTDPSKLEDAAHVSGDRGMAMLGIADDNTPSPTSGTAGDYVLPAISSFTGALQVSVVQAFQSSAGAGLMNLEDAAHSSGDTGVPSLAVRQDTPASSNADNDYGNLKTDSLGRLWTNPWLGTEATYTTVVALAEASISNTYGTLVTNSNGLKHLEVYNGTDTAMYISFDASTNHWFIPAGSTKVFAYQQLGLKESSNVSIKYDTNPSTGSVYASAMY